MNPQAGESRLGRPLAAGEILVYSEINFQGKERLISDDIADLSIYFPVASIRLGPETGVTLFSEPDYGGTSQKLASDLGSLIRSRLQDQAPESLRFWTEAEKEFSGYWAIETAEGEYLSVRPDPEGIGVLTTSEQVGEREMFQILDAGEAGPGRREVSIRVRGELFLKPDPLLEQEPLTIDDLEDITQEDEAEAGFRKFSLLARNEQWVCYDPAEKRFFTTADAEERTIFCRSIKIAVDESQVGALEQGEAALFENPSYWGRAWILFKDYADFERVLDLNDQVSSILLGPLTGATLYREARFNESDPLAGKQDITTNLPNLEKAQVEDDQISSIGIWRIVEAASWGITYSCNLSQDFRGTGDAFEEFSAYRTTLRLPPFVESVDVWTTDTAQIEVDDKVYSVDEDHRVRLQPNMLRSLIITIDAIVSPEGEEPRGTLSVPGLKIRTNTMYPNERIVIFPDQDVHKRLADLKEDELFEAQFKDQQGNPQYVFKEQSDQKRHEVREAQSMVMTVMSTVQYSESASGSWQQTISPEMLGGKSWALDFLTYRVTAEALYVRKGPGTNHKATGYLRKNDVVEVLELNEDGSWYRIHRISDGLAGWCSSTYLGKIDERSTYQVRRQYRVTARGLHVREGPGVEFRSLGYLQCDDVVTAIAVNEKGTWRKIIRSDGLTGWSYARYMAPVEDSFQLHGLELEPAEELPVLTEISALSPQARFHEISEQEVQALLAVAHSPDSDLAQGFWDSIKNIARGVVDFIDDSVQAGVDFFAQVGSFIVTKVEEGLAVLIKIGKQVIKWIADTAEKVVRFVEGILEKIGAMIEEIIRWLRFLFEWGDILHTRDALSEAVLQALDYLKYEVVLKAEEPVRASFDQMKQAVTDAFDDLILKLGGQPSTGMQEPGIAGPVLSTIIGGLTSNKIMDSVEWFLSKVMNSITGSGLFAMGTIAAGGSGGDGWNELNRFLRATPASGLESITAIPEGIIDSFAMIVKNPDQPNLALARLLQAFRDQLVGLLETGEDLVTGLIQLIAKLIESVKSLLTTRIRIPFISDILELFGVSISFSILDAAALIVAVPTTVLYKVLYGKAPFRGDDLTAKVVDSFTPTGPAPDTRLSFEAAGAMSGLVGGIINSFLDMQPEMDQEFGKGAAVTDQATLTIPDIAEVFSYVFSFVSWLPSVTEMFDSEDEDGSASNRSVAAWFLFTYEALYLVGDLVTMVYGKFIRGKIERFKRGTLVTTYIASTLGVFHIALFAWQAISDDEFWGSAVVNILTTLPELASALRKPEWIGNTIVHFVIVGSDMIAGCAPFFDLPVQSYGPQTESAAI